MLGYRTTGYFHFDEITEFYYSTIRQEDRRIRVESLYLDRDVGEFLSKYKRGCFVKKSESE